MLLVRSSQKEHLEYQKVHLVGKRNQITNELRL